MCKIAQTKRSTFLGSRHKNRNESIRNAWRVSGKGLTNQSVKVEAELVKGAPREEILRISAAGSYSLIVMGTKGIGLFRESLLGSLAHEMVFQAKLPVLFLSLLVPTEIVHCQTICSPRA